MDRQIEKHFDNEDIRKYIDKQIGIYFAKLNSLIDMLVKLEQKVQCIEDYLQNEDDDDEVIE